MALDLNDVGCRRFDQRRVDYCENGGKTVWRYWGEERSG